MSNFDTIIHADGVDQKNRLFPALREGYFNVDEMSFEDLVELSVDFASNLSFYNKELRKVGDWRSFLTSNEIVIMALIINKDIKQPINEIRKSLKESESLSLRLAFKLVVEIDKWLTDLRRSRSTPGQELTAVIERVIRNTMTVSVHDIGRINFNLAPENDSLVDTDFLKLGSVWDIISEGDGINFSQSQINTTDSSFNQKTSIMNAALRIINAIEYLKNFCRTLLPQSLKTQKNDPAVGLFISFISLYKHAQDNVNGFTQRHLDFYYRDILKTQYKHKSPERAVLNFEIPPKSDPITIKKGAKFSCMKDEDSRDVTFELSSAITVSDAKIRQIHSLRYLRESMITPACDMNFVTRIYKQSLIDATEEGIDNTEKRLAIFGSDGQKRQDEFTADSEIESGIAIASKDLFLEEGERRIEIEFLLIRSVRPIYYHIQNLSNAYSPSRFKKIICELMISWLSEGEKYNWDGSAYAEDLAKLTEFASSLDLHSEPILEANDEIDPQSLSCKSMLLQASEFLLQVDGVSKNSQPFYDYILNSESDNEFRDRLGLLVGHVLLERGSSSEIIDGELDNKAIQLGIESTLEAVKRELRLGRGNLFKKYFGGAFQVDLTTEEGWLTLERFDIAERGDGRLGLTLALTIPSESPSIVGCISDVHGEKWKTRLPLMKLKVNKKASMNPYSLLEKYSIENLALTVGVSGLRNIRAYNNISQLDPSKPFYPFGPSPTTSSYLAVTAPEIIKKNLKKLWLNLNWGELPTDDNGFTGHYSGYLMRYKNHSFKARLNVLSNGAWQPLSLSHSQTASLFNYHGTALNENQSIQVDAVDLLKPMSADAGENELDLGLKTRNGFIKLTLTSPKGAFGHQEYPFRLTEAIEANHKFFVRKKKAVPNPPYTPLLNQLSIDYIASSSIGGHPINNAESEEIADKIYRLHEFGVEQVAPNTSGKPIDFLKPIDYDGQLFLGISASRLSGLITLYFSLFDDSKRTNSSDYFKCAWQYLSSNGWENLSDSRILSDETSGFLRSGIVTIDIPDDISNAHPSMPGHLYWLKICTNAASSNFCSVRNITTHGARLIRSKDDSANFDSDSIDTSKLKWRPITAIPGLDGAYQIDDFSGAGKEEKRLELVTRVSERIRHRSRGVIAWDYERLILEEFPLVGKVKCLPNCTQFSLQRLPGNLLIVVTPKVSDHLEAAGKIPRLSATHLNAIHEYVSNLSSSFSKIEVINPLTEWVQVRCKVVFEDYARNGKYIEKLNVDIGRCLSPWEDTGYRLVYGQNVKQEDVYSYIYNLEYIKYVTEFSMLHITCDASGFYRLGDTVRYREAGRNAGDITPLYPWSLLMPTSRHNIDVGAEILPCDPTLTGIRKLEIGSTFIINGSIVDG